MTEELYESALRHSPDCVSVYELDGSVVYMNPATERSMAVVLADLRGKRLFELYPHMIGTAFHTAFERAATAGEPDTFQYYSPPLDGWFASWVVRVGDRIHVYARDITDDIRRQLGSTRSPRSHRTSRSARRYAATSSPP